MKEFALGTCVEIISCKSFSEKECSPLNCFLYVATAACGVVGLRGEVTRLNDSSFLKSFQVTLLDGRRINIPKGNLRRLSPLELLAKESQ